MEPPTVLNRIEILEFRDGKVTHESIYFGDPWEPPTWRSRWVEVFEPEADRIGHYVADTASR
jgi:hypothetical protein